MPVIKGKSPLSQIVGDKLVTKSPFLAIFQRALMRSKVIFFSIRLNTKYFSCRRSFFCLCKYVMQPSQIGVLCAIWKRYLLHVFTETVNVSIWNASHSHLTAIFFQCVTYRSKLPRSAYLTHCPLLTYFCIQEVEEETGADGEQPVSNRLTALPRFVWRVNITFFPSFFVTDNVTWLKKPTLQIVFSFWNFLPNLDKNCLNNLLSVDEQIIV